MDTIDATLRVGDIQAIRNVLACHSRGVDRADAGLLAGCYHADGAVDYRFFAGPADQFAAILAGAQQEGPVTLHRTAQMWIEVESDAATSESYIMAYAVMPDAEGVPSQRLICGRYLDRHSRREGKWALDHRTYVLDTNLNWPGGYDAPPLGALDSHVPTGGHGRSDPGIALLAQARARNLSERKGTPSMAPQTHDPATLDTIVSRQQIADLTMAYCRGVDRGDSDLLATIFHDDSSVMTGAFNGSGQDFAVEICKMIETNLEQCFHSIANQWLEVDGDSAVGETYVIAVSTTKGADATDTLTGGRYIDRFTRRDGRWGIAERSFVMDWARTEPSTRDMTGGAYAALDLHGRRGPTDPVYTLLKKG